MIDLINKLRKSEQGQSLVELALVLPILIILMFGIMEFGRVFHSYLVITQAAREGARSGVISKDVSQIKQEVQDASPGINLDTSTDISVNPSSLSDDDSGSPLTVTVNWEVPLFTPVLSDVVSDGSFPISASCTMRIE